MNQTSTANFASTPLRLLRGGVLLALLAQAGAVSAQAPVVTSFSPARNARSAARTTAVAIGFSQPLSNSTTTQQALKIFSQQAGGKKAGTATVSGNTLTFDPSTDFKPGETVLATLTTGVQSTSNAFLNLPQVFQFTTAAAASPGTFAGGSEVAVGTRPQGTALGDIDGDGDLDLVTANYLPTSAANGTVSVRLNSGNGTYGGSQEVTVGPGPYSALLSDVDSDGDLDLLSANANSRTVSVRLNNGSGAFSGGQEVTVENSPHTIVVGDVDGDGDLDLLAANYTSSTATVGSTVSVRLNNGDGTFSGGSEVPAPLRPVGLALGDLDNDGDLDFVVTPSNGNNVGVRLNNGLGSFSGTQIIPVLNNPEAATLGDLDGDGDLDLLVANTGTNNVSVRLNQGNGTFLGPGDQTVVVGDGPRTIVLADVDGDTDLDFVTANYGRTVSGTVISGTTASVRLNNGRGVFSGTQNVTVGTQPNGVAVGDVDGDGDLDFVTANTVSNTVSVRLNQALPLPTITSLAPAAGPVGSTLVITGTNFTNVSNTGQLVSSVTFNGVAATNFVVNSATQITVTVPAGATTGPLVVTTTVGASNEVLFTIASRPVVTTLVPTRNARSAPLTTPVSVTFDQPLANTPAIQQALRVFSEQAGGRKAGTTVLTGNTLTFTPSNSFKPGETVFATVTPTAQATNTSLVVPHVFQFTTASAPNTGTFSGGTEYNTTPLPVSVATADMDNDGDLDIVTAESNQATITIRRNTGNGTFLSVWQFAVGTGPNGPASLAVGDIDNDGDLDLVTVNNSSNSLAISTNQGNSVFTNFFITGYSDYLNSVILRDADGDGDLDIFAGSSLSPVVTLRLNNGAGIFAAPTYIRTSSYNQQGITVGDVDNDGDLDLLVANPDENTVTVRYNDGSGSFSGGQDVAVGTGPNSVALGDVDGDGDLDLATASTSLGRASIRLNDGQGRFSGSQEVATGAGASAVKLIDVNGDGNLDLVTANTTANNVSVRLNSGTGTFPYNNSPDVPVGSMPRAVALGDLDANGTLDLVSANFASNTVSVRFNANQPLPTITSLSATQGAPGTILIISGTNLLNTQSITFNGVPVTELTFNSATQVSVIIPPGATTGPLVLTTTAGPSNSVSFNVLPPVLVTNVLPARNARSAPRNTPVAVTFDQPLNTGSATQQALKVFSAQAGGRKAGATSVNGNTLSFTPTTNFKPGETVFASVSASAQNASGTAVVPQVFQFTTATAPAPGTFSGGDNLPTAGQFSNVTVGDVDGDGDLDLVVPSSTSVSVRLNSGTGTFSNGQQLSGSSRPSYAALGDLDSDGDLDLVISYSGANNVSVRLNNGAGTFSGTQEISFSGAHNNLALGDVDGDGDLDMLVPNSYPSSTVNIRLNNGAGTFSGSQEVSVASNTYTIAVGDVDNDGDLDFVTSSTSNNGTVSVRLNNGRGLFSGTQQVAVAAGALTYSVALADVDGDSDLDLLTANVLSSTVSVRVNDGTGTFSGSQEVNVRSNSQNLAVGDVDGDGDLDLLAANYSINVVSIRLNNGTGTFSGTQEISMDSAPVGIALGDLDDDGDLDVVTANGDAATNNTVNIRLNQVPQAPTITSASPTAGPVGTTLVLTGLNFTGVTSVTFNGVVEPSFVVNSPTQLTVTVPQGTTTGPLVVTTPAGVSNSVLFTVSPSLLVTSVTPTRNAPAAPRTTPVAVTFDQPLSTGSATQGALRVFSAQAGGQKAGITTINNNTLSFAPATSFKPGETVFATLSTTAQNSSGSQNLGLPYVFQFTAATAPAAGVFGGSYDPATTLANPQSVALGDVDGDGDLDLAVANNTASASSNSTVTVRLNNGAGIYDRVQNFPVGRSPYQTIFGDVDGDGDLDLLAANSSGDFGSIGAVSVRLNSGNGIFSSGSREVAVGSNPHAIALGDVDGDGDLDLLAANYISASFNGGSEDPTGSTVSVRLNDGAGNFTGTQSVRVGTRPLSVVLGDVDNDGDLDFVTASSNGTTASIRLNNGKGSFAGGPEVPVGFNPFQAALGDIDNDGDLDLLTANLYDYTNPAGNYNSSVVAVRLNDGKGSFSGTQQVGVGQGANSLALGDADGDGDLDLFATNSLTNSIGVRLNNGTGTFSGTQQVAVGTNPSNLALGDVDGNGTLDFVTANYLSSNVSVRLNQGASARVLAAAASTLAEQISLYPNPAHGTVRLQLPADLTRQALRVSLVNALGQTVLERHFSAKQAANDPELELGKLATGLYTVRLSTSEGVVSKRLAVE